jgi:hypothetical protein
VEPELFPYARVTLELALEPEPMDIHEMPAEQEIAAEPEMAEGQEEEEDE